MRLLLVALAVVALAVPLAANAAGPALEHDAVSAGLVAPDESMDPGGGGNSYCWPGINGVWAYFYDNLSYMYGWFLCTYASATGPYYPPFYVKGGYGHVYGCYGPASYHDYWGPEWYWAPGGGSRC